VIHSIVALPLALAASLGGAVPGTIESVLAHPPFDSYYVCGEHRQGELEYIGDDLGTDCVVEKLVTENDRTWARAHEGDGTKNEQWFGWRAQLLSPCECKVTKVIVNPVVNDPGRLGEPPSSMIILERKDSVHFLLAHVQEIAVKEGDQIVYGQPIAKVGNNGYGRIPHVHVGAWKGETALQIRWDTSIAAKEEGAAE